ncbi:glycosyl hydrolase family 18 protein [Priestia aryabhattai]|uniref:LysM peptidoglycan-binding domain-containing protein n=1 Tax=Priestia TaxID=2800373 RepID=UPI000ACA6B18|nr:MULTISPECIES: LysM peptidoglycan-binding domain-containing protein [Priestia]MCM2974058.1 glycosyl hydrolase family 18 protein [Priestia aryabhattai]MDE8674979.1 glycosyl hydrolase family 18 protein [Priestia aryabhattai]MED3951225.1 glycosyl hydrolase family 18 protein [Priestia aryabhattai]MED3956082.1 glycosyl hydrolase family 18 protein [Priestia aryabhattai]MED4006878.1 glycosyl hydrolase family 18 protein [Priestia aryabhattai]
MKKICMSLLILCLFSGGFAPISKGDAASSVGTVKGDNVNVYRSPSLHSSVVQTVKKGEEFPAISSEAGDAAQVITHKVVPGNTLWLLAKQYGVTVSELIKQNQLKTTELTPGQTLKIPPKGLLHKVVSGDTLWKISVKYGVKATELTKLNQLSSTNIKPGQMLIIPDYYVQVQLLEGKKGWIKKSDLAQKKHQPVVMGWSFNEKTAGYAESMKQKNLDVVSPRWFTLTRSDKVVSSSINPSYVQTAHKNGKKVWPLIGNNFDDVLTSDVLGNKAKRQKLVSSVESSLVKTNSDGINVDFENINIKNKQDFVLFIKELKAALKPHGMTVSVDVTRENNDPFWSGSFDRKQIGQVADYVIMMGYEEHWGGSQVPGSVASLPWVKEGTELLMKDVPAHKILLGVPFYTREWKTDLSTKKVVTKDLTMKEAEAIISSKKLTKKWDSQASQYYVEYTENGTKHQIWLEDKASMQRRVKLINDYHLGGAAAWYIGSETSDIWELYNF